MNETLNSLCWNDRLDFVKQLDKPEFVKEIYNMKKDCLAVLPALTIVLELLPFGAVCFLQHLQQKE